MDQSVNYRFGKIEPIQKFINLLKTLTKLPVKKN